MGRPRGKPAREARQEAGVRPEAIATRIDRGKETVTRFEKGLTKPQELELMLAAYGTLVGLEDSRDLIVRAMREWFENGSAPKLSNNSHA